MASKKTKKTEKKVEKKSEQTSKKPDQVKAEGKTKVDNRTVVVHAEEDVVAPVISH